MMASNDPNFVIPDDTLEEQAQNLIQAIIDLNYGRKIGVYQNLGGTSSGKGGKK
jgi:hypothetical protein